MTGETRVHQLRGKIFFSKVLTVGEVCFRAYLLHNVNPIQLPKVKLDKRKTQYKVRPVSLYSFFGLLRFTNQRYELIPYVEQAMDEILYGENRQLQKVV